MAELELVLAWERRKGSWRVHAVEVWVETTLAFWRQETEQVREKGHGMQEQAEA